MSPTASRGARSACYQQRAPHSSQTGHRLLPRLGVSPLGPRLRAREPPAPSHRTRASSAGWLRLRPKSPAGPWGRGPLAALTVRGEPGCSLPLPAPGPVPALGLSPPWGSSGPGVGFLTWGFLEGGVFKCVCAPLYFVERQCLGSF